MSESAERQPVSIVTFDPGMRVDPILKARESRPPEGGNYAGHIAYPPLSLAQILSLTYSNAFHTQCIALKADMSVGLEYEAPKEVERFLESIAGGQPFLEILHQAAFDWECMGNAYFEVARSRRGQIGEIFHVHAQTVFVVPQGNRIGGYIQETDGVVPFAPFAAREGTNELYPFKRYTPLSSWYGLPEWVAALEALRLDQEKKTFYASFFRNYAVPSLALILTGAEFDETTEATIRNGFKDLKGTDNAHRTMLLSVPFEGAEIKFERLMADLKDMPFDKLSAATREEILAAHGVPPRLVGIVTAGQLGGGSEMESQMLSFIEMKVRPRMKYLENRVKLLLRDQGLPEEFVLRGITPSLPKEQPDAARGTPERAAMERELEREIVKSLEMIGGF
jgi:PBSX family phage portal protein